jgi:hypothetical protein
LDDILAGVHLLQHGDGEGRRLARAILGASQYVSACQCDGDALLLDGGGFFEALLIDAHQQLTLEEIILEVVALGSRDILVRRTRVREDQGATGSRTGAELSN